MKTILELRNEADALLARHENLEMSLHKTASIGRPGRRALNRSIITKSKEDYLHKVAQWKRDTAETLTYYNEQSRKLEKQASPLDAATSAGATLLTTGKTLLSDFAVPALLTGAGGTGILLAYLKNKIQEPTKYDLKNVQNRLYLNKIKSKIDSMERQKAMAEADEQAEDEKTQRSLRF